MAVIGYDDRKRVVDTYVYPFTAVCCLRLEGPNGKRQLGSGFLVGPRLVMTAGHNLYGNVNWPGRWTHRVEVLPGLKSDSSKIRWQEFVGSSKLWVSDEWRLKGSQALDWGLIPLTSSMGDECRWFTPAVWDASRLKRCEKLNLVGYPSGKHRTMWADIDRIRGTTATTIGYQMDTSSGQSGSGVFPWYDVDPCIAVGVHNYAKGGINQGTRITHSVALIIEEHQS